MNAPQIIMIVLMAISAGLNMANHGKPRTGKESFWTTLISQILIIGILIWGDFFS